MRLLFLHLSDAHFKDDTFYSEKTINAQVQALNSIGDFDKCFIMFSGDLAFSGQINEYKKVSSYMGKLWKKICDKFDKHGNVYTLVVPGNHDINFNGENRDRTSIKSMINDGEIDEKIEAELVNFNNFYDYASKYNCFKTNKLYDCRIYDCNGKKIQINLINSELFSSCNDSIHDDDKGLHYLPSNVWEKLSRKKDVDLVITMSHRGPEWFDWTASQAFKKHLLGNADVFLYGHEHFDAVENLCQKDNFLVKSIAQGMDFSQKNISYTTILVDFDSNQISTKMFEWNKDNEMFIGRNDSIFEISKEHNSQYLIEPNENFRKEMYTDEDGQNINKYYVFPGVEEKGKETDNEIKDFSECISLITSKRHVVLEGNDSCGKTALLKQIYVSLIGNHVPIYLNLDSFINKNPEMVLKNAFENQYGSREVDFERFKQIDKEKKIVLIDDLSKIKSQYVGPLHEYLFNNVGHIVSVVEPRLVVNFIDQIKEKYQSEDVAKLRILPFYTNKRLELIKKSLACINYGEYTDIKEQAETINNFIRENIKLFSLSPRFIRLYVDYCVNEAELTNTNKNVFGRVFETNLVNRIRKFSSDADIEEYSVLLEKIAYHIHFNERYPLPVRELVAIIDEYNKDYGMHVNIKNFCQAMTKAKVLVEEDNNYYFYKDSFLAYFVAKSLNSRYNNGEAQDELLKLINNICFNINGDILLFLSYITSNLGILSGIRKAAEEHMQEWEEFDIDKCNVGFIFNLDCPRNETLPSEKERRSKEQREERFEKNASQEDRIERKALYSYNRDDINTEDYKIGQALRFMELICKILPGFNHRLKVQEKADIVKDIFEFPNKILYKILSPIDADFENIVKFLTGIINQDGKTITEDDIKRAFVISAETLALNLYDISARLSITSKTVEMIDQQAMKNTNYKIQHMIFYENLDRFGQFTDEANDLYDHTKIPIVKSMVSRVVRKHFLYNKELKIVGKVESVARKYFGKSFKKTDLLN